MITDKWTEKSIDKLSDRLPCLIEGHYCEDCGATLIRDCWLCGAPNCCYECCQITHQEAV